MRSGVRDQKKQQAVSSEQKAEGRKQQSRDSLLSTIVITCQDNFAMTTLNISIPDQMKDFIDKQVDERGYESPSDYFQELLRQEQKRKAEEKLEQLLEQGLSGGTAEMTEEDWVGIRSELDRRIAERKQTTS